MDNIEFSGLRSRKAAPDLLHFWPLCFSVGRRFFSCYCNAGFSPDLTVLILIKSAHRRKWPVVLPCVLRFLSRNPPMNVVQFSFRRWHAHICPRWFKSSLQLYFMVMRGWHFPPIYYFPKASDSFDGHPSDYYFIQGLLFVKQTTQ